MAELYLFNQNDKFINILTEDEGLVDTWFKDYQNHVEDESFVFNVQSNSPLLKYIVDENQVAFYDRNDRLRLARMKDLREITTSDNGAISHEIRVICELSFLELHDHFIEDRRITDGTAQTALNRALEGTRYIGEVTVDLGLATDNFYWIDGIEAVFKILETWGGALKDTITLDDNNEIIERKLWIVQRLGTDNGLIVEPDYNAETISRNTLSYPETALWGQGSSLEIEDDEGELTGGHTRYITFEDVEWKVSKGDPVDKPKGQKWVGDPDALARDGYLDNGTRKHRFGHFSNQDYEDPEELLWATWQGLQERKLKEIMHEATIYESDKKVSLGDTVTILNREYNKPIELQSQITGLEYDILYPDDEIKIVVGKYIDMNEDPLQKEVDDLKEDIRKPRPTKPIDNGSFPDIEPGTPVNVEAHGAFQTIQLFWDYDSNVYISHYEVFGSQISDFVPDEQHLLYRGRVSAFSHEVPTDEMWYYYVRAVNTRGTEGEFSNRVSASSIRIINDDILFGSIIADHLSDELDIADKLAQNTIDRINEGPMQAIEYTQEEIEEAENRILGKLNNEIGDVNTAITDLLDRTSDVEGTVTNVKTDIDTINGEISATIEELTNLDDIVSQQTLDIKANAEGLSAKAEKSEVYTRTATDSLLGDKVNVTTYENKMTQLDINVNGISGRVSNTETNINDLTGDMSSAVSQIGELDVKANNINASVSEVRADFDGLEIGGRNLLPNSGNFLDNTGWSKGTIVTKKGFKAIESVDTLRNMYYPKIEPSTEYVLSAWLMSSEDFNSAEIGTSKPLHSQWRDGKGGGNSSGIARRKLLTQGYPDVIPANTWFKVSILCETPNDISDNADMTVYIYSTSFVDNTYWVRDFQLEKGNKTTDWSPAPEDIDANFTDMRASLDLKADSATLEVVSKRVNQDSSLLEDARSSINVLRSDINLKVDVDGVIASINLSKEGVRIDGNKHHITGQTLIDDAVIGTSAIAKLAVDRFHLKQGIIDNAHIADATIEHGKIKSLNADKITVGDLKGIDIYGAKFRSSAGTDYMEIVGGKIDLMLNNGRKMNLSPTGLYGYNASGSVRFQADQSLVTSAAMGTSNSNVYLASDNGFEARSVRLSSIPGDGNINSYQYNPMRALVYRFPDIPNGYFTLYNGGEFRFTGESITSPVYQDIRAAGYYGNFLDARGSADNIYVRPRTANGELRVTTSGSTGAYRDVRARGFAGTRIGLSTAFTGVKNFYVTSAGDGEVRITARADTSAYRPLRTSKVYETSSEKYKSDIQVYDKSALSIINESVIYDYIKEGSNQREIGLIIEREMPSCIIDEDAVDGYSMRSLSWKAIQELDVNLTTEITRIDDKLNKLELENQYMKQKIKQLEGAA